MIDVARAAGVSSMTVSRAFKDDSHISAKTRQAVLDAAAELGYLMDSTAAGLSSRKTGFVAVTIPSINNANFADTVRGLTDGLRQSRLQVLLAYTDYDVQEEERLVRQLLARRPEAMVLTGGAHTDACRDLLVKAAIPVIETWDLPAASIGQVVGFSNADAAARLVQHLVDIGRRRIAFLGGDANRDTRGHERREGFISALTSLGLANDRLVEAGPPPISMREGALALNALLDRWPDTDSVVCVSDLAAFGALSECQRKGIVVPEQLAICGFGAYEVGSVCVPAITTIDPQPYEIGLLAAERICGLLSGENTRLDAIPTTIVPQLLIRGSTVRQ